MIKLKSLTIKNFKIFDGTPYTINFLDSNLILLDGPNGYGKTSIFDAIELALTGTLSRLIPVENRQNPADVVVAHNGAEDVEVIIELIDLSGQPRIFKRRLKKGISNSSKKISNFADIWELYEFIGNSFVLVEKECLSNYFNSSDFSRDYLLFHYVQQEETSRFLKNNTEVKRAEELARLFGDTKNSEQKLNHLNSLHTKLSHTKREHHTRIESIKRLYKIDNGTSILLGNAEDHFYVFPWLVDNLRSPFWDAVSIPDLNQEKYNSILDEINSIKDLITHRAFFTRSRKIEVAVQQKELINLYIGYYHALSRYDSFVEKQYFHEFITSSLQILKSLDISKIIEGVDLKKLHSILAIENYENFDSALSAIKKEEDKGNGLNTIYTEIIKHHDIMAKDLISLPDETCCTLCGNDYYTHQSLNKAVLEHAKLIRAELSDKEKELVHHRDVFYHQHLQPLIQSCGDYIVQNSVFSPEEFNDLNKAHAAKMRLENLRRWLASEGIEHDELLINNYPIKGGRSQIDTSTEDLILNIRSLIKIVPEKYYEANKDGIFERLYREYFDKNQELLSSVGCEDLEKKSNYIRSLYFHSLRTVVDELKTLEMQHDNLTQALNDISNISSVFRAQIRKYRKKLITDIEIPFYIFSGKILQTHQAGIGKGIFIKDQTGEDELKNVRFVSNWNSDHDVLNTMSSGQISAIVIALTLALNKVYCSDFSSILIDDPVQTMDDINMTSLIELLRNDFKGKQLIISTHEDKVSRYFAYKYLKHGECVKVVNVMQKREYMPSNNYIYRQLSKAGD